MKTVIISASLLASLALAKPLEKRYQVTEWDVSTITVTVDGMNNKWGGRWSGQATASADWVKSTTSAAPVVQATTTSVVPVAVQSTAGWAWGASSASEVASVVTTTVATHSVAVPSVAKSTASTAAAASASSVSGPSDYATAILTQHNLHRSNHSAPAIQWDSNMASIAATIASSCVYAHDTTTGGGGYGQNIGAGALPADVPAMITNQMYNGEVIFYPGYGSEPSMSNFENWGHFSQIVWASTTGVGCATQYCPGGLANTGGGVSPYFTVCNYSPAGNFGGEYAKNVLAPKGDATVTL